MAELRDQPILSGAAVSALIPQKQPIEMVDTLWLNDETTTVSGFTVLDTNIFCENGVLCEPGIIENIAQTAALRAGYTVSQMAAAGEKINPPVGYIGAIKKLVIHELPPVGAHIRTSVTVQQVIFDVTLVSARSAVNGRPIAECEMKIFIKNG